MTRILRAAMVFSTLLFFGCGSDQAEITADPSAIPGAGPSGSVPLVSARLILPAGANLDPASLAVLSQLVSTGVSSTGETLVALQSGGRVLAVVLNPAGEPMLVAFIDDQNRELSVESTVQASLYVGMGTVLLPLEIREAFWEGVNDFPGYAGLVAEAEAMFARNPLFFQTPEYHERIRDYIAGFLADGAVNTRLVTDGAVKSGVQLVEVGGDAVNLVQNFRRRTHAFVYKLNFIDQTDKTTTLIGESDFQNGKSLASDRDLIVSPAAAFNSFIGTLQAAFGGKGLEFFAKESGPVDLSLGAQEKEANYSIRVVGPSATPAVLTAEETTKLRKLELETLALDYFMPVLLMAIAQDNNEVAGLSALESAGDGFLNVFASVVSAAPGAQESIEKGEFDQALRDIVDGMLDGGLAALVEPLLKSSIDLVLTGLERQGKSITQDSAQRILNSTDSFFKALQAVDLILQGADWARISESLVTSRMVEEFPVTVTQNKVTLLPPSADVLQGDSQTVRAVIQDGAATLGDGEAFVYRWSTTGTYGSLRDSVGNSGTSFESSQDTVDYVAALGNFPDDAVDEITCEVFIRGPGISVPVPVGEADPSAKFKVVEMRDLVIVPSNADVPERESQDFVAQLEGELTNLSYNWSLTNGSGTLTGSGPSVRFTANEVSADTPDTLRLSLTGRDSNDQEVSLEAEASLLVLEVDDRVSITPASSTLGPTGLQEFRAILANVPNGSITYQWSLASNTGTLLSNGTDRTTYRVNTSTVLPATDTLRLVVSVDNGSGPREYGRAEAPIEILPGQARINPQSANLFTAVGEEGESTGFSVSVSGNTGGATLTYQWQSLRGFGTITNSAQPTITYQVRSDLQPPLSDQLRVTVFADGREFARDTIEVDITRKIFFITHKAFVETEVINSDTVLYFVASAFCFEPEPGAISYRIRILEHDPDAIPSFIGTGRSWTAGNPDDLVTLESGAPGYRYITGTSSGADFPDEVAANVARLTALVEALRSRAQVTVTFPNP